MWYGIAADAVVFVHVLYVAYVVVGHLAIAVAAPFKWQWARNPWFRFSHLLAIAIVAFEEWRGIRCPLTVWEEQLRALAGTGFNDGQTFMGRLMHGLLFYDLPAIFFTTVHVAAFVLIVQALVMYPPRWFRVGGEPAPALDPTPAAA